MQQLNQKFLEIYAKYFPNSTLRLSKPALSGDGTMLTVLLAKDKEELSNGISQNDPFFSVGSVYPNKDGGYDYDLKLRISNLKPDSPYLYCSSVKVKTRKTSGSLEKVCKAFETAIKNLRTEFDTQVAADNFVDLPFDVTKK